jgi:hypothetical protein
MHLLLLPDSHPPRAPKQPSSSSEEAQPDQLTLRLTVTNPTPTAITLQTTGHQKILGPWGPFQPESDDGLSPGRRPSILARVYGVKFKVRVALRSDDKVEFGLEDGRVMGL